MIGELSDDEIIPVGGVRITPPVELLDRTEMVSRGSVVGLASPDVVAWASRRVASCSRPWTAPAGLLTSRSISLRSTSRFSLWRSMPDGHDPLSRCCSIAAGVPNRRPQLPPAAAPAAQPNLRVG